MIVWLGHFIPFLLQELQILMCNHPWVGSYMSQRVLRHA